MTLPERTSEGEPVHFGGCLCGGVRSSGIGRRPRRSADSAASAAAICSGGPRGKTGRQSPPEPSIRPPASSSRSISSSATRATTTRSTTLFLTRPVGSLEPEDVKPAPRAVPVPRAGAPCPRPCPVMENLARIHVAAQRRLFARPAASFNSVQHVASRLVPQSLG